MMIMIVKKNPQWSYQASYTNIARASVTITYHTVVMAVQGLMPEELVSELSSVLSSLPTLDNGKVQQLYCLDMLWS